MSHGQSIIQITARWSITQDIIEYEKTLEVYAVLLITINTELIFTLLSRPIITGSFAMHVQSRAVQADSGALLKG